MKNPKFRIGDIVIAGRIETYMCKIIYARYEDDLNCWRYYFYRPEDKQDDPASMIFEKDIIKKIN